MKLWNNTNTDTKIDNITEIPHAIPCAPPLEDTWTLLEEDNQYIEKNEITVYGTNVLPYCSEKVIPYIKKAENVYIPVKKILNKTYKTIKKHPEVGIIALGLGAGISCMATKILLNGGLMYCCMAPNITINFASKEKKT